MIRSFLNRLLDIILPHGKEAVEIADITPEILVSKLSIGEKGGVVTFFKYKDSTIRTLLWAFKYRNQKHIGVMFGDILYDHLLEDHADSQLFDNFEKPRLVPVPLSSARMRERGYNQVEIITNTILKRDSGSLFENGSEFLKRKETEHQARLDKDNRSKNIKGVFYCTDGENIKGRNVLLVDDVVTTGATMHEAKKVLLDAGAKKVRCVAVAG